jgi:hypothetical protein
LLVKYIDKHPRLPYEVPMRNPHIGPTEAYHPDPDPSDPNPYPHRPEWINHLLALLIFFLYRHVPSFRRRRAARMRREALTGRR